MRQDLLTKDRKWFASSGEVNVDFKGDLGARGGV